MAGRKKSAPARAGNRGGSPPQLKILICLFTGIFLLFVALIKGDSFVWTGMHNFLFGLFGVFTVAWPLLLCYYAIGSALQESHPLLKKHLWPIGGALLLLGAAVEVFTADRGLSFAGMLAKAYENGSVLKGGGFFGSLLSGPFLVLGSPGGHITIVLLIVALVMVFTGTTVLGLIRTMSRPVKHIKDSAIDTYNDHIERRQRRFDGRVPYPEFEDGDSQAQPDELLPESSDELEEKKRKLLETYSGVDENGEPIVGASGKSSAKISLSADGGEEETPILDEALLEKFRPSGAKRDTSADGQDGREISSHSKPAAKAADPFDSGAGASGAGASGAGASGAGASGIEITMPAEEYRYPSIALLKKPPAENNEDISNELKTNAARLIETLRSFGVEARVKDISRGPAVTRYELQPAAGVKISKITNLADDIMLNLATAGVRIEAPIPNKSAVGIEVPNRIVSIVNVRELIENQQFSGAKSSLSVALGRDIAGAPVIGDLGKMPHVLVAGATGSGKSVCINSILMSLLYKSGPEDVKLLLIDPKVVELGIYNGIPHLLVPVVTDPRKAAGALGWAVGEMLKRYKLFADNNVRDVAAYNELASKDDNELSRMPRVVIVIDELADLMMAAPSEVEENICRLAQMARAAGMHLVIATQRPSVDVITGVIKANIPSRIAFSVSSQVDSRTILDMGGAEKLIGRGDMLYYPVGAVKPVRVQGCFVSDKEVEAVVDYVKGKAINEYDEEILAEIDRLAVAEKSQKRDKDEASDTVDEMYPQAVDVVLEAGLASTSLLQRRLKLGYARAARVIDQLEERGIVGPFEGARPRQVLITRAQWMEIQARQEDM